MELFILSLKGSNETIDKCLSIYPDAQIIKSVNGFDKQETINEFNKLDISFHHLHPKFSTYGMLANGITKLKCIQHQILNKIPYITFIEDDMLISEKFIDFVKHQTVLFNHDKDLNIIRLHQWGEGYITSLNGAMRIWDIFKSIGIINNIDNQLNHHSGKSIIRYSSVHFKRTSTTNSGDCLKTEKLDYQFFQSTNSTTKEFKWDKKTLEGIHCEEWLFQTEDSNDQI